MSDLSPAAALLAELGLPTGDDHGMKESSTRFDDGADFRIEVPVVNSFATLTALVARAHRHAVVINRVTETMGLFRHTRGELIDYLTLTREEGIAAFFSVGPRATYDTSATRLSPHGSFVGYRLRGMDQIRYALEDVLRGVELGCRNFVVYDEGLLHVLAQARSRGELSSDVRLKASAHLGYANPIGVSVLENLGADSVNPIRDLPLAAMASIRQMVSIPLDLHTDNPPSSGGFIRSYEAPSIVRVARPVYLKAGNSALQAHGQFTSASDGERMADQASIIVEMLDRFEPELRQSPQSPSSGRTPATLPLKLVAPAVASALRETL